MNDAIAKALILMALGMGVVFAFLTLLVVIMNLLAKVVPRLAFLMPDPEPPRPKARPAAPAADGGALALDSSDRTVLLSGANSGDGRVEVRSDDAWPLSILSISVNYEIQPLSNSEG